MATRILHTGVVNGLQCRFCIAFGRKERVGSKRKTTQASGQAWTVPFRYDNIENHVRTQHPLKWAEYEDAKTRWKHTSQYEDCNNFSADVASPSSSMYKRQFLSPEPAGSGQHTRQPLVYTISSKDIVELIIGKTMYSNADESANDEIPEESEPPRNGEDSGVVNVFPEEEQGNINLAYSFDSAAERHAMTADCLASIVRSKGIALLLFEQINAAGGGDDEESPDEYAYVATITNSLLFELAVRYVSCGVLFRMAESIVRPHTTDVFNTSVQALHCNEVSRMMRVACAANFQKIADLLKHSWAFSIAIDSATHHSTPYLDFRLRIFLQRVVIYSTYMDVQFPMRECHTGDVMCEILCNFLIVLWRVGRFRRLVWHQMEPAT